MPAAGPAAGGRGRAPQAPQELRAADADGAAAERLLQVANPALRPLLQRCAGNSNLLTKELVDLLRAASAGACDSTRAAAGGRAGALLCDAEEIVALGEAALELEELAEIVRTQWPGPQDQGAAHLKLLRCGVDSPQALMRALEPLRDGSGRPEDCELNRLLEDGGFRALRRDTVRALFAEANARVCERTEVVSEGERPVLFTAPHNIYLRRDGHQPHAMEEYTTMIAQRLARQLRGTCLAWSRPEQRRSELLWALGCHRAAQGQALDPGAALDPHNRDPNYLRREEIGGNPWFRQMAALAQRLLEGDEPPPRGPGAAGLALHVDVHGCRDPPATPSHLTVGLAAMRHAADQGRAGAPSVEQVDAFGAALEAEFDVALKAMDLRPAAPLVRVLAPSLEQAASGRVERLSGAWPAVEGRLTQTQQAVAYAGFKHACQLELSKALRKALSKDDGCMQSFGQAITRAWLAAVGAAPLGGLPPACARARRGRAAGRCASVGPRAAGRDGPARGALGGDAREARGDAQRGARPAPRVAPRGTPSPAPSDGAARGGAALPRAGRVAGGSRGPPSASCPPALRRPR